MLIGMGIDDRGRSFNEVSGLLIHRVIQKFSWIHTHGTVIFGHLVHPSQSTGLFSRTYVSNILSKLFL